MTTIWCENKYCAHNAISKCEAEDVGFKCGEDGLYCSTYKAVEWEYPRGDDDGW